MACVGGHLSVPGSSLRQTSNSWGAGPDVFFGIGPRNFPFLVGAQVGFDWFGRTKERFEYDGVLTTWNLDRRAFWTHAVLRFSPSTGSLRPHVDLLGGVWWHDVGIDQGGDSEEQISGSIGDAHTGSYGLAAGVHWVSPQGITAGLSLLHLRGGQINVPNTQDVEVTDDVLYYSEATATNIHQWTLMLTIGASSQ